MDVDMKQIKKFLKLMDDNQLVEISVKNGDDAISLRKHEVVAAPQAPVIAPSDDNVGDAIPANCKEITSPMVGTFYRAPSPEAVIFVNVGDFISSGQVLCILEAMKLMNEFKSEVSGKIVKILVENGEAVEFGQPLFLVEG